MYVCFRILRILWILLTSWVVAGEVASEPEVELQLHHGVYFRPLGEVIVTGSDWTVCTSISLAKYEEAHTSLLSQISQVEERMVAIESMSARKLASVSRAEPLYDNLSYKIKVMTTIRILWNKYTAFLKQDLVNYMQDLRTIKRTAGQTRGRDGRGLLNVVSNVGKYLFGFSTQQDVQKVAEKINSLAGQGEDLTHIVDQQFSYIKSVATQALHNGKQLARLENSMTGMIKAMETFDQLTSVQRLGVEFTAVGIEMLSALALITEGLSQTWKGLDTVRRITAKAGEGTLAWELFEGPAFRNLLNDLGTKLPTGWKLLYDAEDHYSYLHYISTQTHRTAGGLNLCMAIPIVKSSSRYQLYEAIPMPVVHPGFPDKLFFSYNFESTYLAIQKVDPEYFTAQSGNTINFFTMNNHREAKCLGENPRVCSLDGAVQSPSPNDNNCLYDLFTDENPGEACPVQVQYHKGPIFRHVGMGVWLYGAAEGTLDVQCSGWTNQSEHSGHYKLTGTGAFRLKPGCEASLGQIKVPSYVNGKGQFRVVLPDAPIVNLFSLNFTVSLWSNITSDLTLPDNLTSFLKHLTDHSDIEKNALDLKTFNESIQTYQALQSQLPPYHPYRWASHPEGQVTGFTFLLLLNITTAVLLAGGLWKIRRRMDTETPLEMATPNESHQLVQVRRRRRQIADEVV